MLRERLTVHAKASAACSFVAGSARAFVLAIRAYALLVADLAVLQHAFGAFLLHHAFRGIDDILSRRTEALRSVRCDFAFVVALETLARRTIRAGELIVGAIDMTVAEL